MSQIPLLILGDSPSLSTGLARIGRDIALLAARLPQFRVAYLGRGNGAHLGGGIADSRLPFMQYTYQPTSEDQWGARVLPDVWRNWSRGERGVILTIWDPSRLTWFGDPRATGMPEYQQLEQMLIADHEAGLYEKWGYFAIDAEGPGPNGALPGILASTIRGYDRVLAYSLFGKRVIDASFDALGDPMPVDWLPHGYNGSVFRPQDRAEARQRLATVFGIYTRACGELATNATAPLIGCVMSNQPRKDWGLWARIAALIATEQPSALFWCHTDTIDQGYWDLRILLDTFGLERRTIITADQPSDAEMAWRYSACDVTMLPSLGEGFGYPLVESLACGVPAIHGTYGAGSELLPDGMQVEHDTMTLDTRYCLRRPVYDPRQWAWRVRSWLGCEPGKWTPPQPNYLTDLVAHLEWRRLAPAWERWLVAGAERLLVAQSQRSEQ